MRLIPLVAVGISVLIGAGCSPVDPITARAASDLPPGPLQPLPPNPPPPPDCRSLTPSRGETRSTSDADFLEIIFTNSGREVCVAHGYPTITMRNGGGSIMGNHATLFTNGAARYLELKPGESGVATVRFPKPNDQCTSGSARIEILIPGATERQFISETHPYCPGWTVTAIERASF